MGNLTVKWLLASMEALVLGEAPKEFIKSHRVGSRAFLAQRCSNSHGRYQVFEENGNSGRRGFVIIKELIK